MGLWVRPEGWRHTKTGDQWEHRRSILRDKSRAGSFAVREAALSSHFLGLDGAPGGGRGAAWMGRHHQAGDLEQPLKAGRHPLSAHLRGDLTVLTPAKLEAALCAG